jgi:hypothetical protein
MSTCAELELPVFIGAPADGSLFLNSVKLWALARMGKIKYGFDYDLHEDVFESCAYHHWGLFDSEAKSFAILILGGGVPKNYSLQPEPTLSQIFFLEEHSRLRLRRSDCFLSGDGWQLVVVPAGRSGVVGQGESGDLHDADGEHAGRLLVVHAVYCARAGREGTAAQSAGAAAALCQTR